MRQRLGILRKLYSFLVIIALAMLMTSCSVAKIFGHGWGSDGESGSGSGSGVHAPNSNGEGYAGLIPNPGTYYYWLQGYTCVLNGAPVSSYADSLLITQADSQVPFRAFRLGDACSPIHQEIAATEVAFDPKDPSDVSFSGLTFQRHAGMFDNSFGTGGQVVLPSGIGGTARVSAIQTDGKVLIAGVDLSSRATWMRRLNADGSPDMGFGSGSVAVSATIPYSFDVAAMTMQPDGKPVILGTVLGFSQLIVFRLKVDGSLDTSFNGTGFQLVNTGTICTAAAISMAPNGKIVAAGTASTATQHDFLIAQLNADGTLDTGFAGTGTRIVDLFNQDETARALSVRSDGQIFVAGETRIDSSDPNLKTAWTSLSATGTVATRLMANINGVPTVPKGIYAYPDGRVLVATTASSFPFRSVVLVRFTATAARDSTFGDVNGTVTIPFGNDTDLASLAYDGTHILVAGSWTNFTSKEIAVARVLDDGLLDTSFGDGTGKALLSYGNDILPSASFGTSNALLSSMSLYSDGRILLVGEDSTFTFDLLARLWP